MNSRELMKSAMRREPTDRIPTMPQICYDFPIRVRATENNTDWQDGYKECLENPILAYDYVVEIVQRTGCDGLRMFCPADSMKVLREGEDLIVVDPDTNQRIGKIDLHGGGAFLPDKKPPAIETLNDAKARLGEMIEAFTDEKLELLCEKRASVSDLFVASPTGGITMSTYNELRGREQAMIDFFERPDFVSGVMEMQADARIKIAEKLLKADIDAFYIGDPSASASLISPQHFEQFCFPGYQKFCQHFADTDILIYIHICGNANPILEMMADTGAHVVEPLDPMGGVEVADAKARIGNKVALMGGVNPLILLQGSVEDVRAETIAKCREGGPWGYILAAGDMVPPETPLENLQAMVDVARKSLWK